MFSQLPQPPGDRDQPVDGEAGDSEAPLPPNSWLKQVSEVDIYPRTFYSKTNVPYHTHPLKYL